MKIAIKDHIKGQMLEYLLNAHRRVTESRDVNNIIIFSDYLLKFSKNFGNEVIGFGAEDRTPLNINLTQDEIDTVCSVANKLIAVQKGETK